MTTAVQGRAVGGEYDHEPSWRSSPYLAAGGALDLHDDGLKVTPAEAFLTEENSPPENSKNRGD